MDIEDTVVPVLIMLIIVGAPIAAWVVSRVLAHQERMEMLRQGFVPPPDPHDLRRARKYGWQPGPMPPPGAPGQVPPIVNYGFDPSFAAQQQLRKGMQVAFIGLALLIGLSFIGYRGDTMMPTPGPWLLGGLIPMFVGIGQVISALLGGAHLGIAPGMRGAAPFNPGAPAAPPPPNAAQAPSGSYGGWRPGPTPEIEKPASPPDYR